MEENANNDPIGKALGIPEILGPDPVQNMIIEAHNDSAAGDFDIVRANMLTVMEVSKEAIFELHHIASSSQEPKAFEVLAKLVNSHAEVNKSLITLHEKIKNMKTVTSSSNPVNARTINNNLFVGSTNDLGKLIEEMREKKNGSEE